MARLFETVDTHCIRKHAASLGVSVDVAKSNGPTGGEFFVIAYRGQRLSQPLAIGCTAAEARRGVERMANNQKSGAAAAVSLLGGLAGRAGASNEKTEAKGRTIGDALKIAEAVRRLHKEMTEQHWAKATIAAEASKLAGFPVSESDCVEALESQSLAVPRGVRPWAELSTDERVQRLYEDMASLKHELGVT